jgi:mRNA-degrading endonuclease RelE of RelBE toxin-antitoxin system
MEQGNAYEILGWKELEKKMRGLPKARRRLVAETIDGLAIDPRPANAEPLTGYPGLYRIRFGGDRLIYRVDDEERTVKVSFEKRGDAYKPRKMQRR